MSIVPPMYIIFILALFLVIPLIIGIYVYRDAQRRGMNAALWTIIAVLSPSALGLIIYLVVRSDQNRLECPSCYAPVTNDYASCPQCGTPLKSRCTKCDYPLSPSWEHCPQCGESVPIGAKMPLVSERSENGLGKILLAVIIIPILIVVILIAGLLGLGSSQYMSIGEGSGQDIGSYAHNEIISEWLETSSESEDGIYVLVHKYPKRNEDDPYHASYIIYYKGLKEEVNLSLDTRTKWLFDKTFRVGYQKSGGINQSGYHLYQVEYTVEDELDFEIYVNGKKADYHLTTSPEPLPLGY